MAIFSLGLGLPRFEPRVCWHVGLAIVASMVLETSKRHRAEETCLAAVTTAAGTHRQWCLAVESSWPPRS